MGLRKEWEERARELGKREGRAEGRAELLLKLLRLKFGEIPPEIVARVRGGSTDELDAWGERVLTAATLEDVIARPDQ